MPQITFSCTIEDFAQKTRFSADVVVKKKFPIRATWHEEKKNLGKGAPKDRIELADIIITPVSYQIGLPKHDHFVLYDWAGKGMYIVRNEFGDRLERRECSMWDLGDAFASRVLEALKELP